MELFVSFKIHVVWTQIPEKLNFFILCLYIKLQFIYKTVGTLCYSPRPVNLKKIHFLVSSVQGFRDHDTIEKGDLRQDPSTSRLYLGTRRYSPEADLSSLVETRSLGPNKKRGKETE